MLQESFLHRIEGIALRHAFNGQDFAAVGLSRKHQAGIDGFAVGEHRAGAALARLAAALYAPIGFAAQNVEQKIAGRDGPLFGFAVHSEADL